ncbi:unnamed protein product [Phytophthora fragariaefolia]|uniref:Unnamed protein product n=1 Tax=Phytophthora fragariaefolia TaxID=1490495 RepID=A0A9W6YGD2_9STRA|nr:unnamed protein product [Phytophthora fragariaefolia]
MNNGVIAALQRGVFDLIIVGGSRLAIQQSMGVIACRNDALQVELARHKELTKKLNSVRYLQVARHDNSAADSMATEALEAKAGRVVLSTERKAELRALNKIPEMLYACKNSTDIRENSAGGDRNSADDERNPTGASENSAKAAEEPSVTATTRSRARQVRFEDEREENGDTTERSEEVFENRSRPPTRRRTTRHETEFGGNHHIAELPVELGEVRTPDANDLDPLVIQAERRQRISKAQDEELRWADLKAYLKGEFTQLSHRRAHNAGKVADQLVLSKYGLLYRQEMAGRPEELGEASRVEDVRHAGAVPFRATTTELSRVDSAREQVEADSAHNGSRVEDARHAGAVHFRVTITEISRVDSARQQVERNSAMVEAMENSAALRDWSCGAPVATCGTSESWSHRKALSHNWSGGASVAPYGTSEVWWRKQNLSHQELRVGDDAGPRQPPKKCPEHRRSPAERLRSSRNVWKAKTEVTKIRATSLLAAQLLEARGVISSGMARTEQVGSS